jgi:HK97 family phage major capsid protein
MSSKLEELKEKRESLASSMQDLLDTTETECRELSADEKIKFDEANVECEKLTEKIRLEETLLTRKSEVEAGRIAPSQGRAVPPVRPATPLPGTPEKHSVIIPATVKRWGNLKSFPGSGGDVKAYKAGKFLLACMGNQQAKAWLADRGIDIDAAAQREGSNTAGGYLVYDELDNAIIDLRDEYGVFSRNARRVAMTSDLVIRPRRTGGLTAYAVTEDTAVTESNKEWDKVQLSAKKWGVISRITNELNEDGIINIADDLTQEIAWAFAKKMDECGFIGTGAATYHGIKGVTQRLKDVNGVDDGGGLCKGAGDLFSDITVAELAKFMGILPAYARRRAKIYCSTAVNGQVFDRLKQAGGGNTVRDLEGAVRPQYAGIPIELTEAMPSVDTTKSTVIAYFGDLALAADFGDRRQTTIKISDSAVVGSVSTFERDESALIGTCRWDINVHDVGTSTAAGPIVGFITHSA